ncbi:hypothetical protein P7C71_g145, partial [Lecanoromycetidae sp. Uapishka_2]
MPPPDADLYPEATGLAKSVVAKHSEPQPLKLFAGWFCPFDQGTIETVRSEFLGTLKEFTNAMDEHGPFFLGKEPSLVDFVLAPWAVRLWVFDHYKGGLTTEGHGEADENTWSRWRKWLSAIEERPSIQNTTSHKEHYLPIYQRYADNTAQSELAKAARQGKGVP